jgi:hypothetical protein
MADRGGTIHYSTSLDGKPVKEGLEDLSRHAQRHAQGFSKLFALEPLGERRGARAITALAEGLTATGDSARGAVEGVTAFGRALSVGIVGGAVIGAITTIVERFADAHEEALKLETAIGAVRTESSKAGGFEGIDKMRSNFEQSIKLADDLHAKIAGYSTTSGSVAGNVAGGVALLRDAALHGQTPGAYKSGLTEDREKALQSAREEISKIADKTSETAKIEHDRFNVSERQAQLDQEEIRHKETAAILSEQIAQTDERGQAKVLAGQRAEDKLHGDILEKVTKTQDAVDREAQLHQSNAQIQLRIANLSKEGLTRDQLSIALAKERVAAAQNELLAAQDQVEATKDLSEEQKAAAQVRLTHAQAGAATAQAGVAEARGSQLEDYTQEEQIDPAQQLRQRQAQYQAAQRAASRLGYASGMVEAPEFRNPEYDPFRRIKAAIASKDDKQITPFDELMAGPVGASSSELAARREKQRAAMEADRASAPGAGGRAGTDWRGAWYPTGQVEGSQGPGLEAGRSISDFIDRKPYDTSRFTTKAQVHDYGLAHQMSKAPWVDPRDFDERWQQIQNQPEPAGASTVPAMPSARPSPGPTPTPNDPLTMSGMTTLFDRVFGA